jgi:hypothetical protein
MTELRDVRRVRDPLKRIAAAAALAREAEEIAEEARARRDRAAVVLRHDYDMTPVAIYRDVLGMGRSLFNRILDRTEVPVSEGGALPLVEEVIEQAKADSETVRKYDEIATKARDIRDTTALDLIDSGKASNADVSRVTGLSTARIAQLRKG